MAASWEETDKAFKKFQERYEIVSSKERALEILADIDEAALDFETTALFPDGASGKVRLTTITNDDYCVCFDHFFIGDFEDYVPHMLKQRWWVYNAKFEVKWFDYYDETLSADICDVDFLAKAKLGGHPTALKAMAARDLKIILDKTEQSSDWSRLTLTRGQYEYGGFDSWVTWELFKYWDERLTDDQFNAALFVFNHAVRGTVECEDVGLYLDRDHHAKLVDLWRTKHAVFERTIRRYVSEATLKNIRSGVQLDKYFRTILPKELLDVWPKTAKKKQLQFEGKYLKSVGKRVNYPFSRFLAALAGFKYYDKYLSTYGDTILTKHDLSGRITSRYNIAQAATGRYSSSNINGQNLPRKPVVRSSFISPKGGNLIMVLADYSGIEVRVLAELSQDPTLLHDAIYGDVHAASAAQIFDHDLDFVIEVLASKGEGKYSNYYPMIKEQRSKAKGFTFQLTYGAGPDALSDVLRCTYDEAVEAIQKWADRYPLAYGYRNIMFDAMNNSGGYLPVVDGRTIKVFKDDQTMPVAANYPIQGAAASVMYRAVGNVHGLFHKHDVPAWLCATVHDELLAYAEKEYADEAMGYHLEGMRQGWLDIFPNTSTDNLLDYAIGTSWAAKP